MPAIGRNNINGLGFDLYIHHGAGAYICGEETAMLEGLGAEGRRDEAALSANVGLYGAPTLNNVRSVAVMPTILGRGAAWFAGSAGPTMSAPSCSAYPAM